MLVKIGDRYLAANLITGLGRNPCHVGYALIAYSYNRSYLCGNYDTEEDVIKAMDEAAEKINAAQGFKPAAEKKVVMKYEEHGDKPSVDVYRCSRCKKRLRAYGWYNFCPYCGKGIERWEE